jgi:flavin-dependent dehydrogenase
MYQDPWTGEGMDHASTHAIFLAEAIGAVLSSRETEASAWRRYHERRDEHALEDWRETGELARDLNVMRRP